MSADRLIHDATASTKGTIYQLCVAVQKCYEMVAGQKVLIECQGDITIPNSQQVETKHYSDALTDNHSNIWKTLQNWTQDDFEPEPYASLILYTTQQFGARVAISKWNETPSQERLEILETIYQQAEERESERQNKASDAKPKTPNVLSLQRSVLDLSRRDKLNQVIEKFVIEAGSPILPELHTVIKQQYIKGILDGKKGDFLDALIGFITQAPATREQRWEITYDRFDKKVGDLIALYNRETRVFPRKHFNSAKLPDGHQVDAHRDHAFVQKIRDIEYHSTILKAIRDYIVAVQTINEEFKNYEVPPSRTKNYANELVEIFEARYRVASRKCTDIIADSQNFFDIVTVEEPREFEGFDRPPTAFRNGLLHTQLNDDVKLRWRLENK